MSLTQFERMTLTSALQSIAADTTGMTATAAAQYIAAAVAAGTGTTSGDFVVNGNLDAAAITGDSLTVDAGLIRVNRAGDASAGYFQLDVDSGQTGSLVYRTGTSNRWWIRKGGGTESGTNNENGSDLDIIAYHDGGLIGTALTFTRATMDATFGADVTVGGSLTVDTTGAGGGHAYLIFNSPDLTTRSEISMRAGGSMKWRIFRENTTNDLKFNNSTGTTAFMLDELTGDATFASDVTVGGDVTVDRTGDAAAATLTLNADGAQAKSIAFQDAGTDKWLLYQAGADGTLRFYSQDAGLNALLLDDATGDATFGSDVTVGGDLTVDGGDAVIDSAGTTQLRLQSSGAERWAIRRNSSVGSDLEVYNYGTGKVQLALDYSSDAITTAGDVTVGGDIELGSGGPTITGSSDDVVFKNGSAFTKMTIPGTGNVSITQGLQVGGDIELGSGGPIWTSGTGTPESAVTAPVGSIYSRTDGGAGTSMYVKESGTGNTGWVAK